MITSQSTLFSKICSALCCVANITNYILVVGAISVTLATMHLSSISLLLLLFQMCFQKRQMEKDVEEQKQKVLRSEQSLQASQSKEQDLRKKMEVELPLRERMTNSFLVSFCFSTMDTSSLNYIC